jgi:hypothetical protein
MLNNLIQFANIWVSLAALGFILIFFRSDSDRVAEDIDMYFYKRKMHIKLGIFILLIIILPISVPYSLSNILTKKK